MVAPIKRTGRTKTSHPLDQPLAKEKYNAVKETAQMTRSPDCPVLRNKATMGIAKVETIGLITPKVGIFHS